MVIKLRDLLKLTNNFIKKLKPTSAIERKLNIEEINRIPNLNCIEIILKLNTNLLGEELFKTIWSSLSDLKEWNEIDRKIIIIVFHSYITGHYYYIHKNVVIKS